MDLSESPVADWSKEEEYNNWFIKFDATGDEEEDAFEVYESVEGTTESQGQGDDDDE